MDSISGSISHGRREAFDRWLDAVEAHLREYEAEQVRERNGQLLSAAQLTEMEQTFAVVGRGSGQGWPQLYEASQSRARHRYLLRFFCVAFSY